MKTFEQQRVEQLEEALLRERNALEAVREERDTARNALKEANAALYAVGAPLGSATYFKIRGILTADTNAIPLRDYSEKDAMEVLVKHKELRFILGRPDKQAAPEGFKLTPDLPNRQTGEWLYINHANTWQLFPGPVAEGGVAQKQFPRELTEELRFILGRPNHWCAHIARRLRVLGRTIPEKAEEEQAHTIGAMLDFYECFGSDWREEFESYLRGDSQEETE